MKNLLSLFVALMVSTLAFAQAGPKPTQLQELPDGHVIIGGVDGANDNGNTTVDLAAEIAAAATGSDDQNLILTGDVLTIESGTGIVNLAAYLDNTDDQDIERTGNTISNSGSTPSVSLVVNTERGCAAATGATVTLPAAVGSFNSSDFTINGIHYQGSAAATTPIQVTGTTLQAGANLGFPIEAGDEVCWDYAL